MTDRDLLLVAYHFPPFGGSGVQRALKLARYLPETGWRVHVLTAAHAHYPLLDESLNDELGPNVQVHRVSGYEPGAIAASLCRSRRDESNEPSSPTLLENRIYWRLNRGCDLLHLPETEMLWIGPAVRAARKIINKHAIRAVVTTSPPHSIQRVGRELQRRLGIPWIADLRDPILDAFVYDPPTSRADRYWCRLEKMIVSEADRVVVTCPDLADRLQDRYQSAPPCRFTTITNGYDPGDYSAPEKSVHNESHLNTPIATATPCGTGFQLAPGCHAYTTRPFGAGKHADHRGSDKCATDSNSAICGIEFQRVQGLQKGNSKLKRFRLGSVGVFYRAQTIQPILKAVRAMLSAQPNLTRQFEFRVVGTLSAEQRKHLRESDDTFLTLTGQQTHAKAVAEMAAMDSLFLMTPDHPGGRYCIPAKTFEYLAFGGHILALVHPDTALERILREAGNVTIGYHGETAALQSAILKQIERWAGGCPNEHRDMRALRRFRRDTLATEFAGLLNACTERSESVHVSREAAPASSPAEVRLA
ncbi:MAG: glycosyltransferase [Phycisphaerae bacterium]